MTLSNEPERNPVTPAEPFTLLSHILNHVLTQTLLVSVQSQDYAGTGKHHFQSNIARKCIEANRGREQQALNLQTTKAQEGTWIGRVCQPKAAHFGLLAELRKKS